MLNSIKRFFNQHILSDDGNGGEPSEHGLRLATAALMVEVSRADRVQDESELDAIRSAIGKTFELSPEETNELVDLAKDESREATSYYEFTSLINESFGPRDKVRVLDLLWQVAFADGELNKHEEALVRRIAGLIHVPHHDFIDSKLRVQQALGRDGNG